MNWPPVREHDGKSVRALAVEAEVVDRGSVDVGHVGWQTVDSDFVGPPVVPRRPVFNEAAQRTFLRARLPARHGPRGGPPRAQQPRAQLLELRIADRDHRVRTALRRHGRRLALGAGVLDDLEGPDLRGVGGGTRRLAVLGAAGVAAGEVLRGVPLLEVLLAAPARVDQVLVGALDRPKQLEPLEAVARLHRAGASPRTALPGWPGPPA